MLAANRLPVILQTIIDDGADGVVLMTQDGSILSSVLAKRAEMSEIVLAAMSSSTWNNINQGGTSVTFHLIKLEQGYVAITTAGKGYLIAAYGTKVAVGLLKSRLQLLSQYFSTVFEQIK